MILTIMHARPLSTEDMTNGITIRACVTSIMRTYYTWKIVQSPDITYNLCIMGLWAYAEISIGIVVSCLPVLPKFFNHFGPTIYGSFSLRTWSVTLFRPKMRFIGNTDKTGTSSGFRGPCTKRSGGNSIPETWNDSNHSSELKGAYINLDKYETQSPKSAGTNGITPTPVNGPATRREDLESGQCSV